MRSRPKPKDPVFDHGLPPARRPGVVVGCPVESEDIITQARGSAAKGSVRPWLVRCQRLCAQAVRRVFFKALLLHETLDRPGSEAVSAAAGPRHAAATALHLALSL